MSNHSCKLRRVILLLRQTSVTASPSKTFCTVLAHLSAEGSCLNGSREQLEVSAQLDEDVMQMLWQRVGQQDPVLKNSCFFNEDIEHRA